MSQSQSSLRFSLEESVWFKKGQEVEELLSISLDPHITIQEQEQYVQIQGCLQLSGEYRSDGEEDHEHEQELDLHGRFAQNIEYREEEDVYQFEHRFPVDVTIPKTRIENLEAIDVIIDTFDYSLPEKGYLKLNADLAICGIRSDERIGEDNEDEEDISTPYYQASPPSIKEIDEEVEEVEPDYHLARSSFSNADDEEEDDSEYDTDLYKPFTVEARKKQDEEEVEVPVKINYEEKNETPILQFGVLDSEELESESEEQYALSRMSKEESPDYYDSDVYEESPPEEVLEDDAYEEQESPDTEEQEQEKKKKKKFGKYESISIADFFARKEDEKAAKLKVCIVQQGESLDILAEKYDISVQQILRMNHLELNQEVYEGQVLYIPSYASATKSN